MRRWRSRSGWCRDGLMAVDFGSSTTRLAGYGGRFLREHAWAQASGTPGTRGGVVVDPRKQAEILGPMLKEAFRFPWTTVRAAVGLPAGAGPAEREAARAALRFAGVREFATFPRALAGAIGSGAEVGSGYACSVVDIGEALTECAVVRSGSVVEARVEPIGWVDLREAVVNAARSQLGIPMRPSDAERIVRALDVAPPGVRRAHGSPPDDTAAAGRPACALLDAARGAVEPVRDRMLCLVTEVLRAVPARFGAEIVESGIHLTGGGALLRGLRECLERETGLAVHVPEDPLRAVVRGTLAALPVVVATGMWSAA